MKATEILNKRLSINSTWYGYASHEFVSSNDCLCHIFASDGSFLDRGLGGYYVPEQTTVPANGIDELQDLIKKKIKK